MIISKDIESETNSDQVSFFSDDVKRKISITEDGVYYHSLKRNGFYKNPSSKKLIQIFKWLKFEEELPEK